MWKNIGKSALWGYLYIWASTIGVLVATIGFLFENFSDIVRNPDIFPESGLMELVETIIVGTLIAAIICIVAYILYKIVFKHPLEINRLQPSLVVFCLSLGVAFNLIVTYVLDFIWSFLPEDIAQSALESTAGLDSDAFSWVFLLVSVGIVIPIAEEIIFRHGICRVLARNNRTAAILVSSLIFGIAHDNLVQGVYTTAMGLLCALIILNTDNIWYPICVHIGLNSTTVITSAFSEDVGMMVLTILGFICIAICATMLIHKQNIRELFNWHAPQADSDLVLDEDSSHIDGMVVVLPPEIL